MAKTMAEATNEITDALSGGIQPVGNPEEVVYTLPVTPSSLMDYLAEELYSAISLMAVRDLPVTIDEVKGAMRWLLKARLAYVSGIRGEVHPRDIEYPAILGPVLASIGKWRDGVANVTVVPTIDDEQFVEMEGGYVTGIKSRARLQKLEGYDRVISALRVMGVPTVFGLPLEKTVDSDEFYRIDVANKSLCGSRREPPSAITLFARALVEATYLSNLFGEARIQYTALSSVRNSIHDVILRNIDGMRVRST